MFIARLLSDLYLCLCARVAVFCLQYAPSRGTAASKPAAGNPFVTAAAAAPATSPTPAAAAPPGPIATTADVSASAFAGVSEAQHVEGLRKLYAVVAPEKLSQVRAA